MQTSGLVHWFINLASQETKPGTEHLKKYMMMSYNENAFLITGPLWGESTGGLWIPLTKTGTVHPMNYMLNAFLITSPSWGESTCDQCFLLKQASSAVMQSFEASFVVKQEQAAEQTIKLPVICDDMRLMWSQYNVPRNEKCITMLSHNHHIVSNHQSLDCLFNSSVGPTSKKHQSPHYWPFMRWPVNSLHNGPVMQKKTSMWWHHNE